MSKQYRVWVRFLSEMQYVLQLNDDGSVMTDGYDYCIEKEAIDLMRYSNWYDNEGNLICEGDIVKDHIGTGVVKYSLEYDDFRVSYGDGTAKWLSDYNISNERKSIQVVGDMFSTYKLIMTIGLNDENKTVGT